MDNVSENNQDLNIIAECTVNNRTFVITADKKIYEKNSNNEYRECSEDDKETEFLRKYTREPKSLDIDMGEDR